MAFYSEDLIDEVLSTTDIVDLVNEYVPLKRRGANYLGLCPFHKEKTPSFTVSPDKQIYKCFGCGQGGTAIQFISKLENLDFKETLEFLAERGNIDLKRYEINSGYTNDKKDLKDTIMEINKSTARYFFDSLNEQLGMENSNLKQYLIKRKLDKKTIVRFGLGFGSKRDETLMEYLTRLGYKTTDILASGVVTKNMKGEIYENFSSRLIFPIFDTRDRVIAFGGRVLDKSLPKYVNSPENALYHKGSTLYGMNVAKKEKLDNIIIVEGYMDTVALHKSEITNVVASLGTALTEKQAKLIKKYTDTAIISYDQDNAGQAATLRAIDILNKEDLKVKVLLLDHDDVKDPDEYINKYGKEKFNECVKKSISHVEYKIMKLEKILDRNDFNAKVEFLTKVATIISTLKNDIEKDMYIDLIAKKYTISKDALRSEVIKKNSKEEKKEYKAKKVNNLEGKMQGPLTLRKKQEEYIIALIFSKNKKLINRIFDRFKETDFEYADLKELYKILVEMNKAEDLSKVNIMTKFDSKDEGLYNLLTEILAIDLTTFDKDKLYEDLDVKFKKYYYQKRRGEILDRLKENISYDEKQMLQIELGQIVLKIAKL